MMFRHAGVLYIVRFTPDGAEWMETTECDGTTFKIRYVEAHNEVRVYTTAMTIGGWLDSDECIHTQNIK